MKIITRLDAENFRELDKVLGNKVQFIVEHSE